MLKFILNHLLLCLIIAAMTYSFVLTISKLTGKHLSKLLIIKIIAGAIVVIYGLVTIWAFSVAH